MAEWLIDGLKVFFLSMTPLGELRAGIPFGIGILKMNVFSAFAWSITGNMVPVFLLLKFLDPFTQWLFKHFPYLEHHVKKYFLKLHTKHSGKFDELGALFLAAFVAIPIPGTGAWTGAILAYLFNIPFKLALPAVGLGILGAGIIVTSLSGFFAAIF